ncbi:MAG TPA: isoprenylcysteine carboxylmethyltransferase family protein [Bryobacteraceae bacterium]|nr:isoprenylcysteine carboxylmethyltransferase family protein [Bryobacteraceae bacterium]
MNPLVRPVFLIVAWALWLTPFSRNRFRRSAKAVRIDRHARWGILIVAAGYFSVYTHRPDTWQSPLAPWRLGAGVVFALLGTLLAWQGVRNLGRQWRVDAGLNADHELVRTGPYRLVRHPIYAAMLCMFLMSIFLVGTLPGWPVGLALFVIGTEIRIRVEDNLLSERFGEQFRAWQKSVPAYLPFVR